MIKLNYKTQFVLFVICLFFIGLGITDVLTTGLLTDMELFWQISHFVAFVLGASIFGANLYTKRVEKFKD